MEEEIQYTTVVFSKAAGPPKENTDEETIYSTVNGGGSGEEDDDAAAAAAPSEEVKAQGEAAAPSQNLHLHVVCLGILCVLLLGCIIVIIYFSVVMTQQTEDFSENLRNLTMEMEQLMTERSLLENRTTELLQKQNQLNWTLNVILEYDEFPVSEFCPEKRCQPCRNGWLRFQESCYFFYERESPWKMWEQSQKLCTDMASSLVVVDSSQEQEFISNHSTSYFDDDHGYWLGLRGNEENDWVWVDGSNATQWYWVDQRPQGNGPCTLLIPIKEPTGNWRPESCFMFNKFICESDVLMRTPVT